MNSLSVWLPLLSNPTLQPCATFDAATASLIAAQTVKGAAELLLTTHTHPEQEIDKVTTPKGCTTAGLNEMEHHGFSSSLIKGIAASFAKIG